MTEQETKSCSRCNQGDIPITDDLERKLRDSELVCDPCRGMFSGLVRKEYLGFCPNCDYVGRPKTQTSWGVRIIVYAISLGTALIFDLFGAGIGQQQVCAKCSNENVEKWNVLKSSLFGSSSKEGDDEEGVKWGTCLLLSILLGILGADRFYMGQKKLGALKLITMGGLYLWWLIDIVLIATKNIDGVNWI